MTPDELATVLECVPVRRAPWSEDGGRVVVEVPRPAVRGPLGLLDLLSWWAGPRRIRLDPMGSEAWRRLGRGRTVAELAREMEGELEDRERLPDRLAVWAHMLAVQELLVLELPARGAGLSRSP